MFAWPDRPPLQGRIAIVDFRMGNLFSIEQACAKVGLNAVITDDRDAIQSADAVILPGMGAFGRAMENLRRLDLIGPVKDVPASGRPLIGVCLGLQLLMRESEEFGQHQGLGLIEGNVRRLTPRTGRAKVPQIGWNRLRAPQPGAWATTPLRDVEDGAYMYFVHSYYVAPADKQHVSAETTYGEFTYCSALHRGSIHAFQFHPERSGPAGLSIYRGLAEILRGAAQMAKQTS
jgi:glutamine amidotransferase